MKETENEENENENEKSNNEFSKNENQNENDEFLVSETDETDATYSSREDLKSGVTLFSIINKLVDDAQSYDEFSSEVESLYNNKSRLKEDNILIDEKGGIF